VRKTGSWIQISIAGLAGFVLGRSRTDTVQNTETLSESHEAARLEQRYGFLDTKAGIALGFAGALIALAPDGWGPLVIVGTILDMLAAAAALRAFSIGLPGRRTENESASRVSVEILSLKEKWVARATRLLAATVVLLGVSVLVAPTGRIISTYECWVEPTETVRDRVTVIHGSEPYTAERWRTCWRD
jgi:hypothetical protein